MPVVAFPSSLLCFSGFKLRVFLAQSSSGGLWGLSCPSADVSRFSLPPDPPWASLTPHPWAWGQTPPHPRDSVATSALGTRVLGAAGSHCQPHWLVVREVPRSGGRFGASRGTRSPIRAVLLHGVVVKLPEPQQCGICWQRLCFPDGSSHRCGVVRVTPGDTQSSVGMEGDPGWHPELCGDRYQAHSEPSPAWALRTCCPILPRSAKP